MGVTEDENVAFELYCKQVYNEHHHHQVIAFFLLRFRSSSSYRIHIKRGIACDGGGRIGVNQVHDEDA